MTLYLFESSGYSDYHFPIFIFNWRIIALQYFIGFYQTSTSISHRFTHVPPTSLPSRLSEINETQIEPQFEFPESYNNLFLIYEKGAP